MKNNITISDYSKLLGHLYEGHIEEHPYSNFLASLREIMELNFAAINLREPIGSDGGLMFISSDLLQKTYINPHDHPYIDRYYTSNLMPNLPWGEVVTLDGVTSYNSLESSDLYKICMEPMDLYHMAGIDLRNANGQRFTVRICRPKTAPNFNTEERQFFGELGSHIQRAVATGMQLIQLDTERRLYAKTISGKSIGIITLDEQGKVLNCNLAADEIIANKDGISLVNQQIYANNPSARSKLNGYIQEIIAAQRAGNLPPVNALSVERSSNMPDYEILIKPLAIERIVESVQTPHMMIFINAPEKKNEIDIRMLMSLYNLTRAEAMLARHLAAGESLGDSANLLGIARNTARAQLRAIFSKTGVTQQSMLVSLILKSLATFH
ncbi:helix-turn-helix transcriptional regulator [Aestuariicella hydrocarbonica]|uniref:Helix-turn-helix transcriptional regulator n=1 Tax=Pseudomaricurvus hydrocarbonicus TaxID=1470433 RepID=A0A9E5JV66_9GAMM|nr:helix-turn-helix transcriptional regulator [Aestuariicella hydrocarbonica]NHO66046.1 helix-turn-helix transcriptional regulator [Aestuariicella hydrocarbonica]